MHFKFVDFVRFWSLFSIVFIHCLVAFGNNPSLNNLYPWVFNSMKYGTICFYIISGFLLGNKFEELSALDYFKRRLNNTGLPYLIALLIFILWVSIGFLSGDNKVHDIYSFFKAMAMVSLHTIFYTNYWFVINLLISLAIILIFKKIIFRKSFIIAIMGATLIYTINVYQNWFEPRHTSALFGFIFYLWLGVYLNYKKKTFFALINKIPFIIFLLTIIILIFTDKCESDYLADIGSIDPFNTLKISNQILSFCIFLLLIKLSNVFSLPQQLNVRKETFGIYLYHSCFIWLLLRLLNHIPFIKELMNSKSELIAGVFFIITFILIYISTTVFVKIINKSSLSWILGNIKEEKELKNIQQTEQTSQYGEKMLKIDNNIIA